MMSNTRFSRTWILYIDLDPLQNVRVTELFNANRTSHVVSQLPQKDKIGILNEQLEIDKPMTEHFVIVGGGQAGAQAVQTLRQNKFDGKITLIGEEPYPPYQRPPLSKKYLAGELERDRLFLRPLAFYEKNHVDLQVLSLIHI